MIIRILKFLFIFTLIIFFIDFAYAEDNFSIGAHLGLHHNVGNLDTYDPRIQIDPQNNCLLGFSFKTNLAIFFARFGADTTFLINRGRVQENSSELATTKINYLSFPLFIGYNYNVLDIGNFYMGPGLSFFMARGRITSSVPSLSDDIDAAGWGYGFLVGIEYKLIIKIHLYIEWEYFDGRSEPGLQGQSYNNWDDLYIDFTGHRLIFGIRYYLI